MQGLVGLLPAAPQGLRARVGQPGAEPTAAGEHPAAGGLGRAGGRGQGGEFFGFLALHLGPETVARRLCRWLCCGLVPLLWYLCCGIVERLWEDVVRCAMSRPQATGDKQQQE